MAQLIPLKEKNSQYEPDEEEIRQYAEYLGFQLPTDDNLLWIARQGLKADLPDGWEACTNPENELLFKNTKTGIIQEEHPLDDLYRQKYRLEKKKKEIIVRNQEDNPLADINEEEESERTKTITALEESRHIEPQVVFQPPTNMKKMTSSDVGPKKSIPAIIPTKFELETPRAEKPQVGLTDPSRIATQTSQEDLELIQEYNVKMAEAYSLKIRSQIQNIKIPVVKPAKPSHESLILKEEVDQLSSELVKKREQLEALRRERIRKQKELVDMEVEYEVKKKKIIDSYRQRLKRQLEESKRTKKHKIDEELQTLRQNWQGIVNH